MQISPDAIINIEKQRFQKLEFFMPPVKCIADLEDFRKHFVLARILHFCLLYEFFLRACEVF